MIPQPFPVIISPLARLNSMSTHTMQRSGTTEVRVGATDRELRDDGVPVAVRVVHEEARIRGVVGVEGKAEQTALAAAGDPPADIEEWTVDQHAALHQADPARLFDDEQPPAAITGVGDVKR